MRELTTAERVSNVQSALFLAEGKVYSYVFQEIGTAGYEALKGIIPALLASLAFVTLTTAVGAGAGAAVGSLGFGVGVVPLGIAAGTLGFKTGLWILNLVGLAFLIEHMGSSLQEAVRYIESGLVRAWGPKSATDRFFSRDGDVEKAADDIALGIAVIIRCILEGVVLFLTAKGISKLPELVANLKRSKLGEGFAIWIEQNYQQLLNNPRLNSGTGKGTVAGKTAKIIDHANVSEQPISGKPKENLLCKQKQITKLELERWYQKQNDRYKDPDHLSSHLSGTDFTKPVYSKTLPTGTEIIQYEVERGPGMYATYPGTSMNECAICGERTLVKYKTIAPIEVIESTTAKYPVGKIPNVGGDGGGQQIILPAGWQTCVRKVP